MEALIFAIPVYAAPIVLIGLRMAAIRTVAHACWWVVWIWSDSVRYELAKVGASDLQGRLTERYRLPQAQLWVVA